MAFTPAQNALLYRITNKFCSEWPTAKAPGNHPQWKKGDIVIRYMRIARRLKLNEVKPVLTSFSASVKEKYGTLKCCAWVSEKFPPEKRCIELSWSHHRIAANSDNPTHWLTLAAEEKIGTRELACKIAESKNGNTKHYRGSKTKCTMCTKMVSRSGFKLYEGDALRGTFCSYRCLAKYTAIQHRPVKIW